MRSASRVVPSSRIVLAFAAFAAAASSASAQGPTRIEVTKVVKRSLEPRFEVLGEARAVRQVDVGTEIAGLVSGVRIEEGDPVEGEQILLEIETSQRQISLRAAKARLVNAREQLGEYERGSRKEEIAEARAEVARAEALVVEAEDELARIAELLKDKVASERDRIRAKAVAESRRAELTAAKAKLERIEAGPREELIARARASLEEVQAEVDRIEDQLKKAKVPAPFPGVVVEKYVERGAFVQVGARICKIVQIDPIEITLAVPERLFARMPRNLPLDITFDAFPGRQLRGKIHRIVPVADPVSRTIPVRVRIPNEDGSLLPGMVARGQVPTPTNGKVLTVPWDAIVRTPRGRLVYKIVDGMAKVVPVTIGARQDAVVEVRGDLQENDVIATRGNERLMPDAPVVINEKKPGNDRGK